MVVFDIGGRLGNIRSPDLARVVLAAPSIPFSNTVTATQYPGLQDRVVRRPYIAKIYYVGNSRRR